jgi:hypothetical protein
MHLPHHARRAPWLMAALAVAVVVAACGSPSSSPSPEPTQRPTPTPVGAPVSNAEEAAALVIATDPRFTGTTMLNPDAIGASRWWTSSPLPDGGFRIELTIGWGDCPAGCINRHVWTYDVSADGTITPVSESGDEVPAVLPG